MDMLILWIALYLPPSDQPQPVMHTTVLSYFDWPEGSTRDEDVVKVAYAEDLGKALVCTVVTGECHVDIL